MDTEDVDLADCDTQLQAGLNWALNMRGYRDEMIGKRIPHDLADVTSTLASFDELAKLDSSVEIPLIILEHTYSPCTTALESLQKVTISDLKVEARHHATVLVVRSIRAAVQTWSRLLVAVQDETGLSCVLMFNQHMRDVPAEEFIPEGAVLAIKEPHLHIDSVHPIEASNVLENTFWVIRVDQPTDLIVLPPSETLIPTQWLTDTTPGTAISWKEMGNAALVENHVLRAHRCYTEAIRMSADSNDTQVLSADFYRNRAYTAYLLGFYDDSKSDALKSFSLLNSTDEHSTTMNGKALFRAARAALSLGRFEETRTLLTELDELTPDYPQAASLSNKVELALQQQSQLAQGSYNFAKLRKQVQGSGKVDFADFLSKTQVQGMSDGGYGLFATQDIGAGDLVLCEKAFAIITSQDAKAKPAYFVSLHDRGSGVSVHSKYGMALRRSAFDKISRNKSTTTQLNDLMYGVDGGNHQPPDEGAYNDAFFVSTLVHRYAVTPAHSRGPILDIRSGLWARASHLHHSCMPNSTRTSVGDLLIVRATRAIKCGEQLFISLYPLCNDYGVMKASLSADPTAQQVCSCATCVAEEQTSPAQRAVRQKILKSLPALNKSFSSLGKSSTSVELGKMAKRVTELAKELATTYDDNVFTDGIPRRGLSYIYQMMPAIRVKQVAASGGDPFMKLKMHKLLEFFLKALRAHGCKVAVDSAGNVSFSNPHHADLLETEALLYFCYEMAQPFILYPTAQRFLALAKETHLLSHIDTTEFPLHEAR